MSNPAGGDLPRGIPTPEGYLGAQARITSGPAPELVAAGYAVEVRDAPLLHDGLTLADLAHVTVLAERGLLPEPVAAELLAVLLEVAEIPADEFPYDVVLGDAYNSRERELTRRAGDLAGWVHLGRTRREAGRIAFRLALRERLLDLAEAVADLAEALADRAADTADAVWADMTYLQPAQPSTFGHYLASFAEEAARHLARIRACYSWVDVSPGGSGGVGGTRLGLDRDAIARELGFATVGRNTRDTMWNVDGLVDVTSAATQSALTADRLCEDLQIMASPGFGLVELDASLCRASVLMPQKRNPYALSAVRAGTSTLIGRLTGVVATGRTPSAATDNWLHAYGEVTSALELARDLVALTAVVVGTLTIDREALERTARDPQTAATDLADEIVLRTGTDYRTAYRVVGRAVARWLAGETPLSLQALADAADEVVGRPVPGLESVDLAAVLDPRRLVHSRTEPGGSAPDSVRAELDALRPDLAAARAWVAERRAANADSRARLLARARARAATAS
ncbi:MAG: lyase family protein [Candidatus Nanopelagicales bacterium]